MIEAITRMIEELKQFEDELETDIDDQRKRFSYTLQQKKVVFERAALEQHRKLKSSLLAYIKASRISSILSAPFVYAMILPIALLDLSVSIFQAVCFRLWEIPRLPRSEYIILDRHKLAYLNGLEKLNCIYCGYANGVIAFTRDIAGRTEEYWCPIKHASHANSTHSGYHNFLNYGDADAWRNLSESWDEETGRD